VRDPVGQRVGFSRSGAGNDEEGRPDSAVMPHAVFDSAALFGIEFI
jgi:hypothetical protein